MIQWSEEDLTPGTVIRWRGNERTVDYVDGYKVTFTDGSRASILFMNREGTYELVKSVVPEKKGFGRWITHLEAAT